MTYQEAQQTAKRYGALIASWRSVGQAGCWIDRIEWLPSAAERGPEALAEAIAEANRYA